MTRVSSALPWAGDSHILLKLKACYKSSKPLLRSSNRNSAQATVPSCSEHFSVQHSSGQLLTCRLLSILLCNKDRWQQQYQEWKRKQSEIREAGNGAVDKISSRVFSVKLLAGTPVNAACSAVPTQPTTSKFLTCTRTQAHCLGLELTSQAAWHSPINWRMQFLRVLSCFSLYFCPQWLKGSSLKAPTPSAQAGRSERRVSKEAPQGGH